MSRKTGFMLIIKPEELNVERKEVVWDFENNSDDIMKEIIVAVTGTPNGKISCSGLLPHPIENTVAFLNWDQSAPETKYNFNFFGSPIFGNIVFLGVDPETEEGKIIPLINKLANNVEAFVNKLKTFERKVGIYDAMTTKINKEEFIENFLKEKTNAVKESIDNSESEELKRAKEELKQTQQDFNISDDELQRIKDEVSGEVNDFKKDE